MTHNNLRFMGLFFSLLIGLASLPGTVAAESAWTLRLQANNTDSGARETAFESDNVLVTGTADQGEGASVTAEYRFAPHFGLEFGLMGSTELEVGLSAQTSNSAPGGAQSVLVVDNLSYLAQMVGLNLHLTPNSKVDVFLGPLLAYVSYGTLDLVTTTTVVVDDAGTQVTFNGSQGRFVIDDDTAFGANLGVDVQLGDGNWRLGASVRYLDSSVEVTSLDGGRTKLDLDPLVVGIGVGYRF